MNRVEQHAQDHGHRGRRCSCGRLAACGPRPARVPTPPRRPRPVAPRPGAGAAQRSRLVRDGPAPGPHLLWGWAERPLSGSWPGGTGVAPGRRREASWTFTGRRPARSPAGTRARTRSRCACRTSRAQRPAVVPDNGGLLRQPPGGTRRCCTSGSTSGRADQSRGGTRPRPGMAQDQLRRAPGKGDAGGHEPARKQPGRAPLIRAAAL